MKTKLRNCSVLVGILLMPLLTRAMDTGVSWAVFATPDQPYLEINLEISAGSVAFKYIDSVRLQASVEILILLKSGENVVNYDKYVLNSPLVEMPQSLLDVKRMMLSPGSYQLDITFLDLNNPDNKDAFQTTVVVDIPKQIYLSEVQLLRRFRPDESDNPFSKNGYYLEPLPFNFYDREATTLAFYGEMYHSDKSVAGSTYTLRYVIETEEPNGMSGKQISAGAQVKRPSPIDAALVQMDISKLVSGNYVLLVELRNSGNELLCTRRVRFQRSNPFLEIQETALTEDMVSKQFVQDLDEKTLRYSLKAISPLLGGDDHEMLKNILGGTDLKPMRYFLFRHFVQLDANNPELAYDQFMEVARAVDKLYFSGFRNGFETDRGRTFIRYGKPDDVIHVEDDPAAPPYEIWVYYNFPKTKQKNVKFLFYNPTLAGEDFIVLHSTARGEINNPQWERVLYQRNAGDQYEGDNFNDATRMQRNSNRNARVYFEDF